jgi:chaperonin GroES
LHTFKKTLKFRDSEIVTNRHLALNKNMVQERGVTYMKMKPLEDRVVVKPVDVNEVKKGGIIIPDTAKEKPQEGEVIAVGPGRRSDEGKRIPVEVKKGDRILYGKYSGTEVTIDGEQYLIMRESDILAVL